jgi:hypothetical protein
MKITQKLLVPRKMTKKPEIGARYHGDDYELFKFDNGAEEFHYYIPIHLYQAFRYERESVDVEISLMKKLNKIEIKELERENETRIQIISAQETHVTALQNDIEEMSVALSEKTNHKSFFCRLKYLFTNK